MGRLDYLVIDFFFNELWSCASFKEFIHFMEISKFVCTEFFLISLYYLFEVCILLVHTIPDLCLLLLLIILIRGLSIVLSLQSPIFFLFHWFSPCFCSPRHWFLLLPWFFPSFCLLWVKFDLLPVSSDGRDLLFSSLEPVGLLWLGLGKGAALHGRVGEKGSLSPVSCHCPTVAGEHCGSRGLLWVWGSRLC